MADRIKKVAAQLVGLRREGRVIDGLNDDEKPANLDEAYAIQDAMIDMMDADIIGWKVGASAPEIQVRLGLNEPFAGPIFAGALHPSPARRAAGDHSHRVIESEFALKLGKDLDPNDGPLTMETVGGAIATVAPGMEIVGHVFAQASGGHMLSRIADFGVNEGGIIGAEHAATNDRLAALTNHMVTLSLDGEEVARGTGALALGNPLNSVIWLADHLASRGRYLTTGMVILTGTVSGIRPLDVGCNAIADFGDLGVIDLTFH